jgi:hypothetical protein
MAMVLGVRGDYRQLWAIRRSGKGLRFTRPGRLGDNAHHNRVTGDTRGPHRTPSNGVGAAHDL